MQYYAENYKDFSNAQNALLTTKNPFIVAPAPVYDSLMDHVEAYAFDALEQQEQNRSQPFQVPCSIRDKLPDVVIGLDARGDSVVSLTLSPYDYIRPVCSGRPSQLSGSILGHRISQEPRLVT